MHLWMNNRTHNDDDWKAFPLEENPVSVSTDGGFTLQTMPEAEAIGPDDILVLPCPDGSWALVHGDGVDARVNGLRIPGIHVFEDRDEVRLRGSSESLYFSSERLAVVEPYTGPDNALCPRCSRPIIQGTLTVRCPGCSLAHHEHETGKENWKCWSYAVGCGQCGHSTNLSSEYEWKPGEVRP